MIRMPEAAQFNDSKNAELPPTVLAVDDLPVNLLAIEESLAAEYAVLTATSGPAALEIVQTQKVDLILLDVAMPGMDGYETCRLLKQDDATRDIPVIFLTAAESRGRQLEGLNVGAIDYLSKPVEPPILLARIRNHLELSRTRQALAQANEVLEARVKERTAQIEAANRVKDEFLSTISHELRTPLNGIIGLTDLAHVMSNDSEQINLLDMAKESALGLSKLINRMIDYVDLEAGKQAARCEPINIPDTLAHVLQTVTTRAAGKSLCLEQEIAPGFPEQIRADEGLLSSTLKELLENAIAFTEHGSVRIVVTNETSPRTRPEILFTVEDTGCGIPPEAMGKLFQPFRQVDGSLTRSHGGIGLGLALARKRVTLMGGRIWAEANAPEGVRFRFTVPMAAEACSAGPAVGNAVPPASTFAGSPQVELASRESAHTAAR